MDYDKLKPAPKVGEYYHFWDDGKTSQSRHYICKCERVLNNKKAKKEIVKISNWDFVKNKEFFTDVSLFDFWKNNVVPNHKWLFDTETDYFVECSCPKYDENNLWFVRTKDGGWFSMNIQNGWQGGELDVTGEIFDSIIDEMRDNPRYYDQDIIDAYLNEKYEKDSND